jgi:threonine-phosphate decarboxylase
MIEGHGDDAWKYSTPIKADFSSNVLYGPLDQGLLVHLQSALAAITHYPEAGAGSLQRAAATAYGVGQEQVLVTNGVTEAIYLIAQVFRQRTALIYTPAFAEYEDACAAQGMAIEYRDWDELRYNTSGSGTPGSGEWPVSGLPADRFPASGFPTNGLVFFCNPNNPTGWTVSPDRFGEYPETLFVVDESYIEFASVAESVLSRGWPNVLVLRSLTKSCRIPGLRVGFVIGAAVLIEQLRGYKMPWSVNRPAIEAGLYIFSHPLDFAVPVERLLAETAAWREELKRVTGWKVWSTDTHYFLIDTPAEWPAHALKRRLIEGHGLLVRDASNFRGLGSDLIRVACQSAEHNLLLTQALAECARTGR